MATGSSRSTGLLRQAQDRVARLLAAPAPDLAALAAKIALAADYEAVTLNGCEDCLLALKADAARLAAAHALTLPPGCAGRAPPSPRTGEG